MLWFSLFILSIAIGGSFALLVAIARTPGLADLFPPKYFYHALVGHVDSALIVGLYAFLIFLWHRIFEKKENFASFLPALLGFFMIAGSSLFGLGQALWNNYVPTIIHPVFFGGVSLFFLGVFLNSLRFLPQAVKNFYIGDTLKSILSTTVINSFLMPLTYLIAYFNTPKGENVYEYFEALFWFGGHTHQFVNAGLLISLWLLLLRREVLNLWFLNLLLVVFPITYFFAQIFLNPLSSTGKSLTTWGYMVGIGIPTIVYGLITLVRAVKGLDFYRSILVLSVSLYLLGALMGYMIVGMDTRVPAHYHTVIASILVGVIALTFMYLQELGYMEKLGKFEKFIPFSTVLVCFFLSSDSSGRESLELQGKLRERITYKTQRFTYSWLSWD
ncbi:hypothetical protein [Aquifex aeolicus]|uniref:Uncharacterized protein aq_155 n=1 Tax=Aquifex aeolicus (strain VF5) TaxID=224324 RepID=Y155_AQUAE|nr:hypothetical protein [Aquifex aeolicus]O66545.1 RecName: Full=Uncharacterized protein aq_155 [Aquifex aeolicus VF5]AAC06511.1 putative protein [Aquifex aeolicus VF5]